MPISNFFIKRILDSIRSLNRYDEDDIDMMRYTLQSILWEIEKIIIIFVVFTLMGYHIYFFVTLIVLVSIRIIASAGGYHSKTALSCLFITFTGFFLAIIVLPYIPLNNIAIIGFSIFSLFTTLLAAPMRSVQKDAIAKKDKDLQKKMFAFIVTFVWFLIIFFNKTNPYAAPALWIIVLQNAQLLFEYLRRKEGIKCQKISLK